MVSRSSVVCRCASSHEDFLSFAWRGLAYLLPPPLFLRFQEPDSLFWFQLLPFPLERLRFSWPWYEAGKAANKGTVAYLWKTLKEDTLANTLSELENKEK